MTISLDELSRSPEQVSELPAKDDLTPAERRMMRLSKSYRFDKNGESELRHPDCREMKMQAHVVRLLWNKRHIRTWSEVPSPAGVIDLESPDSIFELKPVLGLSQLSNAVGQLLLFGIASGQPNKQIIIVYQTANLTIEAVKATECLGISFLHAPLDRDDFCSCEFPCEVVTSGVRNAWFKWISPKFNSPYPDDNLERVSPKWVKVDRCP